MAQTSEELKREISQTREQMAETADALAYKADVPTRTKDWVGEKKDAVVSTVTGVSSKVGDVTPDGAEVSQGVNRMKRLAERNPLGLAIGGAAVGFLAGVLLPSTRVEDERIGPMADEVKATAAEAGREALDRGKDVVQEAGSAARRGRSCPRAFRRRLGKLPQRRRHKPLCHRLAAARASKTAVTSHGLGGRHDQHRRPPKTREMVRRGRSDGCPAPAARA